MGGGAPVALLDLVEVDAIFFYSSSIISPPFLSQMAHVAGRQMRVIDLVLSSKVETSYPVRMF